MNSTLASALLYAGKGWRVLPVYRPIIGADGTVKCSCGKARCKDIGKHPATKHGLKDATTNTGIITNWFGDSANPYNIGIATGAGSGIIAIDIDSRNGGEESLRDLELTYGDFPHTINSITGSGGYHFLFKHPGGVAIPNSAGKLGKGIDVRGDGGYIIVPDSLHSSGNVYQWELNNSPIDTELADLPKWLYDLLMQDAIAVAAPSAPGTIPLGKEALDFVANGAPYGTQRARAVSAARNYIAAGYTIDQTADKIWQGLQNCTNYDEKEPWEYKEAKKIAESMARSKPTTPKPLLKAKRNAASTANSNIPWECSDLGNAQRLVAKYGDVIRYAVNQGKWRIWSGKAWLEDETFAVSRMAQDIAVSIYQEAAAAPNRADQDRLAKWALHSQSAYALTAMVEVAKTLPGIAIKNSDLDSDPFLISAQNGTIDLRTKQIRPHSKDDYISKLCGGAYLPGTTNKMWEDYLEFVAHKRKGFIDFLRRAAGYSLTADTREGVLFFTYGTSKTGKSTFIEAVKAAFGDYATTADFESFLARRDVGGVRNDLATLVGARFVSSVEVDKGKALAEGLVKQLTGGDKRRDRFMYKESFEYEVTYKLWLCANDAPKVTADDEAMWNRILRVPFDAVIPVDKRDPALKVRFKTDRAIMDAVLTWAVEGAYDWYHTGLMIPDAVRDSTKEYRKDNDNFLQFIEEMCVIGEGYRTIASTLQNAHMLWVQENQIKTPLTPREFGLRLAGLGCESRVVKLGRNHGEMSGKTVRMWLNVALREDVQEPLEMQNSHDSELSDERLRLGYAYNANIQGLPYKQKDLESFENGETSVTKRNLTPDAATEAAEQPSVNGAGDAINPTPGIPLGRRKVRVNLTLKGVLMRQGMSEAEATKAATTELEIEGLESEESDNG